MKYLKKKLHDLEDWKQNQNLNWMRCLINKTSWKISKRILRIYSSLLYKSQRARLEHWTVKQMREFISLHHNGSRTQRQQPGALPIKSHNQDAWTFQFPTIFAEQLSQLLGKLQHPSRPILKEDMCCHRQIPITLK